MDFQTESAIFQIFGEPLGASATQEQQRQALDKANRTHDAFFQKSEIDFLTGHKPKPAPPIAVRELTRVIGINVESDDQPVARDEQTFTKGSRVSEARSRFVVAVDRFVDQARRGKL